MSVAVNRHTETDKKTQRVQDYKSVGLRAAERFLKLCRFFFSSTFDYNRSEVRCRIDHYRIIPDTHLIP